MLSWPISRQQWRRTRRSPGLQMFTNCLAVGGHPSVSLVCRALNRKQRYLIAAKWAEQNGKLWICPWAPILIQWIESPLTHTGEHSQTFSSAATPSRSHLYIHTQTWAPTTKHLHSTDVSLRLLCACQSPFPPHFGSLCFSTLSSASTPASASIFQVIWSR